MARRPPRKTLSSEDRALWSEVTKSVTPRAAPPSLPPEERPGPKPKPKPEPRAELRGFQVGEAKPAAKTMKSWPQIGSISERLAAEPVRMDKKAHRRMQGGKLSPEARIDLHGMTLAQAHPALVRFILGAHSKGLRLVLVITGKGKDRDEAGPIPVPRGVLKHQVPSWLHQAPLGPLVLELREAHIRHGGAGAYYVYLRRAR